MVDFPVFNKLDTISIDTETYGLEHGVKAFGIAVACNNSAWYYDLRDNSPNQVLGWLQAQLISVLRVVNHNASFDVQVLRNMGLNTCVQKWECTMVRASLIDEHLFEYNLDAVASKYLGSNKDSDIYRELARMYGGQPTRKAQIGRFPQAPVELMERYAKQDALLALRLWGWQEEEIARQDLHKVWSLEKRLFPHIVRMEGNGIRVDVPRAEKAMVDIGVQVERTRKEIDRAAGFAVNPNPSSSMIKLFEPKQNAAGEWFTSCGTKLVATPAGKPSISADALQRIKNPIAKQILECRKLMKVKDTFIAGHILGSQIKGRVFPNINQTKGGDGETEGTGTGRLSYSRPAMQQIPNRDKTTAALVRPLFLPEEGHGWMYGDLEQHEYRVFAHYANSPKMIQAYKDNPDLDMHQLVADLTGLPRSAGANTGVANAKQMNLAMVFCMGEGKLCATMGLPHTVEKGRINGEDREFLRPGEEGKEVIERYHSMVPGIRETARQATSIAKTRGYVRTFWGRHIRFPRGQFTHKASGLVYQGSSADFNKENICLIWEYLLENEPDARLLLNIHDEYSHSLPRNGREAEHAENIKWLIENKTELRVPIRVDFGTAADTWWGATNTGKITGDGWSHGKGYKRNG
jgi:DNA polymerase I-like protein with 3'-5' exonuclease and polymerase domains